MSKLLLSSGARLQESALSLLRIVAGFTFWLHGLQIILGFFGGTDGHAVPVALFSVSWFAGILELIGGALLLLGFFTRPVALVLSGQMAAVFFWANAPRGLLPISNGGELPVLYSILFLYFAAAGAGAWSFDRLLISQFEQELPGPRKVAEWTGGTIAG